MAGFEFHETMSGSFHRAGDPRPLAMSITLRARSRTWRSFSRRREVDIEGEIDAEGFADHRFLRGTLGLDAIRTRTLPYAFRFMANDGATYSFAGKKTLHVSRMVDSMTVLPGEILDAAGAPVGGVLLRFDLLRDLACFLKSFRLSP